MKIYKKVGSLGIVFLVAILTLSACGGAEQTTDEQNETKATTQESTEQSEESVSEQKTLATEAEAENTQETKTEAGTNNVLTKEKFDKIEIGMTYDEVVAIIGAEGTVMSESGEKGSEFHTIIYEFETDGFMSAATMMFQGGKLINKAQAGLDQNTEVEITLNEYNQLETGMSSQEVFNIIGGEGEITSETGEKGTDYHTVMYTYKGKGSLGANAILMFQGEKLQSKSQFGLE